jgi:hypothetical protein
MLFIRSSRKKNQRDRKHQLAQDDVQDEIELQKKEESYVECPLQIDHSNFGTLPSNPKGVKIH